VEVPGDRVAAIIDRLTVGSVGDRNDGQGIVLRITIIAKDIDHNDRQPWASSDRLSEQALRCQTD
jgi:hypothetical protein